MRYWPITSSRRDRKITRHSTLSSEHVVQVQLHPAKRRAPPFNDSSSAARVLPRRLQCLSTGVTRTRVGHWPMPCRGYRLRAVTQSCRLGFAPSFLTPRGLCENCETRRAAASIARGAGKRTIPSRHSHDGSASTTLDPTRWMSMAVLSRSASLTKPCVGEAYLVYCQPGPASLSAIRFRRSASSKRQAFCPS